MVAIIAVSAWGALRLNRGELTRSGEPASSCTLGSDLGGSKLPMIPMPSRINESTQMWVMIPAACMLAPIASPSS